MEFVRVEFVNNTVANAELTKHREIIKDYATKGLKFVCKIPKAA